MITTFEFPVGYHDLHKTKIMDFQLNRWYSLGYCRLEDMQEAGAKIKKLSDWKSEMVRLAEKALAEGRLMNGTFHYRAAEFFTPGSDPDKLALYDRFIDLFYNQLFLDEPLERHQVPYQDTFLPALRIPAQSEQQRGTLVIHGGFDSFIEEFYSMASYFAVRGYEVIMFEGPGQGGARRKYDLPLDYRWERPAKAVLDYFDRDQVAWLGISMGGWMCFRAAAFEPRIRQVIASSIAYDYMEIPPKAVADFARWMLKHPTLTNKLNDIQMKIQPQETWGVENLMYISKTGTPYEASMAILQFNKETLKSDLVTQDVLILTGEEDHFIPMKLHDLQINALTNAHSVTARVFTRDEHGQNHCQVGNIGLALETMSGWLEEVQQVPVENPAR
ncbi:MAG: alpha/beta fold hydrolase [Anaerolineales bacterium]|nr:alpha/beta fold hydrolase [Anaerolineales bacterium]